MIGLVALEEEEERGWKREPESCWKSFLESCEEERQSLLKNPRDKEIHKNICRVKNLYI